ncbi:MAG: permease prefix domain 1-containing protein [Planctomycetota bacterium]|nr:permease prefix domain 1-containing protein [Planctomycetota bacterium]
MFHLETEVHQWCRKVTPGLFFRGGRIAELEDHVYCTISAFMDAGASQENAFKSAIKELGEIYLLRQEFRKNNNILANALRRMNRHPIARMQNSVATVCVIAAISLGASLNSEASADWAKSAIVALCMIPLKWLCGLP